MPMGFFDFLKRLFGGRGLDPYRRRPGYDPNLDSDEPELDRKPAVGRPQGRGGPVIDAPVPAASGGLGGLLPTLTGVGRTFRIQNHHKARTAPRRRRSKTTPDFGLGEPGSNDWKHVDHTTREEALKRLGLPLLRSPANLPDWLGQPLGRLRAMGFAGGDPSFNYVLRAIPKARGGWRVIEAPLPRLKEVQRNILLHFVSRLPVSTHAHGFVPGRSPRTHAQQHCGADIVLCFDIKDFFPTINFNRVAGLFRNAGYGRMVAVALAMLTTMSPGDALFALRQAARKRPELTRPKGGGPASFDDTVKIIASAYAGSPRRRLPQGAPTSPGIANAICWRMDKRLAALARKFGGVYSRYADDLCFSGDAEFARHIRRFTAYVFRVIRTEGFAVNEKKTRILRRGARQVVTGVVVNRKPNLARREFDKLKAILHNCLRKGPASQNRAGNPDFKGFLRGRIEWLRHLNPTRGERLLALFDRIDWAA